MLLEGSCSSPPSPATESEQTVKIRILTISAGILLSIICGGCVVIITDIPPEEIELDPFFLQSIEITEDTIAVTISYSGGCEKHYFSLFMSPALFLESYPVQANLYLRHNGNNDACEAEISKTISFNLQPIAALHKSLYGNYDEIVLNVFTFDANDKISASYFPE